jgi:RNA polymerase sigma-70 factor (ECF subfamily)
MFALPIIQLQPEIVMLPDYGNDVILLEQLKAQDLVAFNYLYNNNRKWLYVLALSIIKDECEAQDLVQDLFIDFWQQAMYKQVTTSIKGYLSNTIKNRAFNFVRNEGVRKKRENNIPLPKEFVLPAYYLENNELKKELTAAMDDLSPAAAKVFNLAYLEHRSYHEIAADLSISRNTVMNHMVRALKILRTRLKNWESI